MLNILVAEESIAAIEREIASRKLLDSWIFLSVPTEGSFEDYKTAHSMQVNIDCSMNRQFLYKVSI